MKKLLAALLFTTSFAHAERFIVESTHPLSSAELKASELNITPFYPTQHEYFSRLYVVETNKSREQLQRLSWVKLAEASFELMQFSLLPAPSPRNLVEDELFAYQWGLLNQGQTYLREKDDIHNLPLKGKDNEDIGWEPLLRSLNNERTVVAVLDSGVDLEHPELKDNLWKNEKECGQDPQKDNDGNQLAGDCHGWNFTEAIDSEGAKNPSDRDGHGTHVAGIIAAAMNGKGIVGVAPNALIMPVKVMRDTHSQSTIPSSESFARGIIYAVDNGARVINMSLGWPRSLETKFLREAVYYALGRGVVIVAAAGNNNSSEPLFPCAYDGVVCVAASSLDGNFAGFSNYGGHVDTMAPGEGILSTNPILFEPDFFSVPGYEIKSGTSQSAPFVAGLIASVLAHQKDLRIDDIFARLYQAQNVQADKKYILGGKATYNVLSKPVDTPVVRPVLKRVRQVLMSGGNGKITIPVRNFGEASGEIKVSLDIKSHGVSVITPAQTIPSLNKGEVKDVIFDIQVNDMSVESNLILTVNLTEGEQERSFMNEIPAIRDMRMEKDFKRIDFAFNGSDLPVGGVRNGVVDSFLYTLESYGTSAKHELFLRRVLKDQKQLELTLFSRNGQVMQQAPKLIKINDGSVLVNFIRLDLNMDGEEDYLVHTLAEKDDKKYFVFSFYNSKLDDLWPGFQDVKLELDVYLESMNDLFFTRLDHAELGPIMVPAFFTPGQLPRADQVLTSWDRPDTTVKPRLYYLLPDVKEQGLRVRALTTNVWEEKIKQALKSKWYETVVAEQLLPVSQDDVKKGQLRLLVSVGENSRRKWSIHTFDAGTTKAGMTLPQLVLQTEGVDPLLKLTADGLQHNGDVYFNIYDRTRSKVVTTQDQKQAGEFIFRHDSETDLVAGHIASFEKEDGRFTVLQTREELISISKGSNEKVSKRAKLRYSFLSQKLLSEMYYPVIYKRDDKQAPGLYVDATAVTGNRVYLFEEQDGELVSSIQNSLAIPSNCRAMNPNFSASTGSHEFVFLCLEGKSWTLRTWSMQ